MEFNVNILRKTSEQKLFWATAILFPFFIFIGFAKSYYLRIFFDSIPFANWNVHLHGIVMTLWVLFFSVQIALVRTKNIKVHMTLGMFGIILAAAVVISGLVTAYDSLLVRGDQIIGMNPRGFLIIPFTTLVIFLILFSAAIYYRKRAFEHKALMFLTAINFLPFGFSRLSFIPENFLILWSFGVPDLFAIAVFIWISIKHRKINQVFAVGLFLVLVSLPLRVALMESPLWLNAVDLIAP